MDILSTLTFKVPANVNYVTFENTSRLTAGIPDNSLLFDTDSLYLNFMGPNKIFTSLDVSTNTDLTIDATKLIDRATLKSIIDAIPTGGSYTFANGLTESLGTAELGGQITKDTFLHSGNSTGLYGLYIGRQHLMAIRPFETIHFNSGFFNIESGTVNIGAGILNISTDGGADGTAQNSGARTVLTQGGSLGNQWKAPAMQRKLITTNGAYTLVENDHNTLLIFSGNAGAITITVPFNLKTPQQSFEFYCQILRLGTSTITINGVTSPDGNVIGQQFDIITITQIVDDLFMAHGNLVGGSIGTGTFTNAANIGDPFEI